MNQQDTIVRTADIAVIKNGCILLIKRACAPFEGMWALPGGRVDPGEVEIQAAIRELREETDLVGLHLTRVAVFDDPNRDPRPGRWISTAYVAVVPDDMELSVTAGDDAKEARWFALSDLPALAFDHSAIIERVRAHLNVNEQSTPTCNHTSVGVIVQRYGSLLLIERQTFPIGIACPAGHVDEGETYEQAAYRMLHEQTGLEAYSLELVAEGRRYQACTRPSGLYHFHDWKVYQAYVTYGQELRENTDACIDWYTPQYVSYFARRTELHLSEQLSPTQWQADPGLEVVWYHFLRQVKLI